VANAWISATRPKTLPAALVPVWAGCVLAWRMDGGFSWGLAAATLLGALCIQVATNLFNDAIDDAKGADTVRRLGPRRVTAGGLMSRHAVLGWAAVFLMGAAMCGAMLFRARGWPIVVIGIPSLYLAYGYTGGPWPLAYRGLGELFVVVFFGWVAVGGTVFIQVGHWPPEAMLLGSQVGLLSAALISINNLRDRDEDAGTGKRTMAVRLGEKGARRLVVGEIAATVLLAPLWWGFGRPEFAAAVVPVVLFGAWIGRAVGTRADGRDLNRWLALAGVQLILFAGAFQMAAWLG